MTRGDGKNLLIQHCFPSVTRSKLRYMSIALLCVQENAADRPTMLDVVARLSGKTMILAEPKHPAYFNLRVGNEEGSTGTHGVLMI
jgi:hypothetical protein